MTGRSASREAASARVARAAASSRARAGRGHTLLIISKLRGHILGVVGQRGRRLPSPYVCLPPVEDWQELGTDQAGAVEPHKPRVAIGRRLGVLSHNRAVISDLLSRQPEQSGTFDLLV